MLKTFQFLKSKDLIFRQGRIYRSAFSTSTAQVLEKDDESLYVRSPLQDVAPVTGITLPELLRENMGPWGNLTSFESFETGVKYTHEQVLKNAQRFGAALIQSGFKRGEIVALVLPNVPEYASIMFGIWDAGLVASPVNPSYSYEETKRQLAMADAVCVITEKDNLESVKKAKALNPKIRSIIVVGESEEGCHSYFEMAKADIFGVEFFKGNMVDTTEELALLPFSSGTTGPPKGVMLTHANLTTNLMQCNPELGISNVRKATTTGHQERQIGLLPFFHSYGLACLMTMGTYLGSHTMCLRKFDQNTFLAAVRKHKPTVLHLVTPLISHIANSENYGPKELESAHSILGGAAPIGPSLINRLLEKAEKHFLFQEGYGMTEASPVTHILLPRTNNTKIGSCGSPIPTTVTKIIDLDGKTVGRNVRGEILVKGPQIMQGYYKNEKATQSTIQDGWLHTGDIAYYDDDGDLFIVDRLKELIKVQGFQVAPSELEDLLRENDKVEDVAVIGVPHSTTGEAPRAYIVKKSKAKLTEEEVHEYLKSLVSKHKYLKGGIEFRESIPKAPSGKILRRELIDEYKQKNNTS